MRLQIIKTGTGANTRRTSEEWQRLYPKIRVLDPDGWDRRNYDYSWHQELITEEEYGRRLAQSTITGRR